VAPGLLFVASEEKPAKSGLFRNAELEKRKIP
jgi:hypothetical protein